MLTPEVTRGPERKGRDEFTAVSEPERVSACRRWNIEHPSARRTVTSEGSALVTEIEDRLIELYVQQDEARRTDDRDRAHELQMEIDRAAAQREDIRRWRV